jgi:hypothetical protein
MGTERSWADYFSGGVPAGVVFDMSVHDLQEIARQKPDDLLASNPRAELCFIGLVAYFEAFCKSHFASMINVDPRLLENLSRAHRDVSVSALHLLEVGPPYSAKLGFLIADGLDFGTPKSVNALYFDLAKCTPFSKQEAQQYSTIIDDRNLLVHHGGYLSPRYPAERFIKREIGRNRLFVDSLVVTRSQFLRAATFVHGISRKLRASTQKVLAKSMRERRSPLPKHVKEALGALAWVFSPEESE